MGNMEWWSDGVMDRCEMPILHYSITPLLHYSISSLLLHPHIQFEFPFAGTAFLQTAQFECSDFRDNGLKVDGHQFAFVTFLGRQRGFDGGDFFEFVVPGDVLEHRADAVVAAEGTGEETKAGVFTDDETKLLRRHVGVRAFFHAEGSDAKGFDRRFHAGHSGHRRLDANIVGARGAAANPQTVTMSDPTAVGRAARDAAAEVAA